MSKVGSGSSPSTRARARHRYWVRSAVTPAAGSERPVSPKKYTGKRFVEPYRLSEAQRASVLAPLAELGIGDDESRSLFAAALEYDLAGCRQLTEPEKEALPKQRQSESAEDTPLAALAEAAANLTTEFEGLSDAVSQHLREALQATDRFQRSYGKEYVESLRGELTRIADVGKLSKPPPTASTRKRAVSQDARRFVLRTADTFEACFDLLSEVRANSPFVATVEAIVTATGIRVPTDRTTLAQILRPKNGS